MGEYLGNDLSKVVNELEKLLINVPKEREITITDIQDNIGISKDFNVFELNKALSFRDVVKANQIIDYFAANPKSNPMPVILGSLGSYFIKVLKCHYAPDKSQATIAKIAGVHTFFAGEYISAMKHYNRWKTFQIIGYLRDYDLKSKGVNSVNTDTGALMKELFIKSCTNSLLGRDFIKSFFNKKAQFLLIIIEQTFRISASSIIRGGAKRKAVSQ